MKDVYTPAARAVPPPPGTLVVVTSGEHRSQKARISLNQDGLPATQVRIELGDGSVTSVDGSMVERLPPVDLSETLQKVKDQGFTLDPRYLGTEPRTGRKDDSGKPRWDLLPFKSLRAVVRVLTFGANKYGAENWRTVPDARARYTAAALRHIVAWVTGEANDPDTGESHLAHAVCCLLFLGEL